jgi:hypothetical protein
VRVVLSVTTTWSVHRWELYYQLTTTWSVHRWELYYQLTTTWSVQVRVVLSADYYLLCTGESCTISWLLPGLCTGESCTISWLLPGLYTGESCTISWLLPGLYTGESCTISWLLPGLYWWELSDRRTPSDLYVVTVHLKNLRSTHYLLCTVSSDYYLVCTQVSVVRLTYYLVCACKRRAAVSWWMYNQLTNVDKVDRLLGQVRLSRQVPINSLCPWHCHIHPAASKYLV